MNDVQQILLMLNINLQDFKTSKFCSLENFEVPRIFKKNNENITQEEFFTKVASSVFLAIDTFTNFRVSIIAEENDFNFEKFEAIVSSKRVKILKQAFYFELNFRISSNSFPEFSKLLNLVSSSIQVFGTERNFDVSSDYLNPQTTNMLLNSGWLNLDFSTENLIPNIYKIALKSELENAKNALENQISEKIDQSNLDLQFSNFETRISDDFQNKIEAEKLKNQQQDDLINQKANAADLTNLKQRVENLDFSNLVTQAEKTELNLKIEAEKLKNQQQDDLINQKANAADLTNLEQRVSSLPAQTPRYFPNFARNGAESFAGFYIVGKPVFVKYLEFQSPVVNSEFTIISNVEQLIHFSGIIRRKNTNQWHSVEEINQKDTQHISAIYFENNKVKIWLQNATFSQQTIKILIYYIKRNETVRVIDIQNSQPATPINLVASDTFLSPENLANYVQQTELTAINDRVTALENQPVTNNLPTLHESRTEFLNSNGKLIFLYETDSTKVFEWSWKIPFNFYYATTPPTPPVNTNSLVFYKNKIVDAKTIEFFKAIAAAEQARKTKMMKVLHFDFWQNISSETRKYWNIPATWFNTSEFFSAMVKDRSRFFEAEETIDGRLKNTIIEQVPIYEPSDNEFINGDLYFKILIEENKN
ncbi:hypothetical protein [Mycoplasmopsis synoviae]|uniref:Uncharacterized protein n=1 Tax=Mycoplasmopsis synoviae TaxID=2109 RepID=A0AAX3F0H8_MYCSY|nr:hypothetical protein [Mycoplasmopsis synoviae]UZW64352.1 hypothetical protein OIE46_03210 [Mycoplasmopsis synoviae]